MDKILPILPFLIPVILIQLGLMTYVLVHILTHKTYKTGTRTIWIVVSFIQIIGPIIYLIFGKSDE